MRSDDYVVVRPTVSYLALRGNPESSRDARPTFVIETSGEARVQLELTTNTRLFEVRQLQTRPNFLLYTDLKTAPTPSRRSFSITPFEIPLDDWRAIRPAERIYYRAAVLRTGSTKGASTPRLYTTENGLVAEAPFIHGWAA